MVVWALLAVGHATSWAALVRVAVYRRPARPAEWLAILLSLLLVQRALPNPDTVINAAFGQRWLTNSFGLCRWIVGGIGALTFLLGITLLASLRRGMPHWAKMLSLATLALVLLWGPLDVFAREVPWLLPAWTG